MHTLKCVHCGSEYVIPYNTTQAYRDRRKFCSRPCADEAKRGTWAGGGTPAVSVEERFWRHVDRGSPTTCWIWKGSRDVYNYGMLANSPAGRRESGKRLLRAHRVSWEIANGIPVPAGLNICHHCDNPPCVNPFHLFVGTHAENMADKDRKGRGNQIGSPGANRSGERNGHHKLSDSQVAEVREAYAAGGVSQQELANRFGVGQSQVSRIVRGLQRSS